MQLILPDGRVFEAAEAVFQTLAIADHRFGLWLYRHGPGFKFASETLYRLVAGHRPLFSWLTKTFWGPTPVAESFFLTRWFFLRSLGLIYLIAFISLGLQVDGLFGSGGILPVHNFMTSVVGHFGKHRYDLLPTVFWINSSDAALHAVWITGAISSVLLTIGLCPVVAAVAAWICYLSYLGVGQSFLSFQWDALLVETGFLAIFFAPLQIKPSIAREGSPSRGVVWLFRLLLFRLMFLSGAVKLLSGDPTWRDFTALRFHYETQPLPTWIGWYAHQLPAAFQTFSTLLVFVIELVFPFFLFLPRRARNGSCIVFIVFQTLIFVTGNYCFFNLLTIALCIAAMDDGFFPKFLCDWVQRKRDWSPDFVGARWPRWIVAPLALVLLFQSSFVLSSRFGLGLLWPNALIRCSACMDPFRVANPYGLFAVMTTDRMEIIIEGSDDGVQWRAYEFNYKPGDPSVRPAFVAPHQPRLDWQMWFAALGTYQQNPWFMELCAKLLLGSPVVTKLFKTNPFPNDPPRFLRASFYQYHFTDLKTRRATGQWWRRDRVGDYCPVMSLRK